MKAWILSDRDMNMWEQSLVYAETRGKAKAQAGVSGKLYQSECLKCLDYVKIQAVRAKEFDDLENLPERNACIKLILDRGWQFYIGDETYNEENIEDFRTLFSEGGRFNGTE